MSGVARESYASAYGRWSASPETWWRDAAADLAWDRPVDRVFDAEGGPYGRWFPGAALNVAFNCLDRHVAGGRGRHDALIWDSPLAGEKRRYSFDDLTDLTSRFAGALRGAGVAHGDRVLIYMPMIPEAVVAMLAAARLGAIHSVAFGGFAPRELASRIADARPKAVVTASCGLEPGRMIAYKPMMDEAITLSPHKPDVCFVVQRPMAIADMIEGRDRDFQKSLDAEPVGCVAVEATDPLYILYTSGTTGKPKGVVRDSGGYAVALLRSMRMIYGLEPGDVAWTASDIGWVVGHSYIVYGPLLAGCTTILYEGKPVRTPDAGAFWRVCEDYGVKTLFTAPTAIRAIRQQDPKGDLRRTRDLSALKAIFLAGERCDPATGAWLQDLAGRPVIDHWWQTETGWPVSSGFREFAPLDQPLGSAGRPAPGWRVAVLDEAGQLKPAGEAGDLVLGLPLPPGAAPTLWNDDAGFRAAYLQAHPGWYQTGDSGVIDVNGDVWIMGRTDDVINVAGHRLSTSAIEEVVASHPAVAECAVVAAADELKGHVPLALFVLAVGVDTTSSVVAQELVSLVRSKIGAIAVFKTALAVARLPKTRSGKVLRKTIRQIADGEPVVTPSTIEDPSVIEEIRAAFAAWARQRASI